MVNGTVTVPLYATETPSKVEEAIGYIFPGISLDIGEEKITGSVDNTDHFVERIKEQRIQDTARNELKRGTRNGKCRFHLNKQTATVHIINFTDGDSVLGDIFVTLEDENIEEWIEESLPDTRRGKEGHEKQFPDACAEDEDHISGIGADEKEGDEE